MGLKYAAIGLAAAGLSIAAPAATIDSGKVVFTYEEAILGDPSITNSGSEVTFSWSIPSSVALALLFESDSIPFDLPDYSATASAGYQLSGRISGFLGNLAYTEAGGSAVSAVIEGNAYLNNSLLGPGSFPLEHTPTLTFNNGVSGYLSIAPFIDLPNYSQWGFQDTTLTLQVDALDGFGQIFAQPQNVYSITFTSTPVPVPAALWLLAPAVVGLATRRRPKA